MRRVHSLFFSVSLLLVTVTGSIYADCSASPTVAITATPSPDGIVTLNVTYSFPDTTSSGQRALGLRILRDDGNLGNLGGFSPSQVSGTWTVQHEMYCSQSGNYTYMVSASSCNSLRDEATAAYTHNVQPEVSVSYEGPDDQGHGNVIVDYSFPNTSHSSQRMLSHRLWQGTGFGTGPFLRPTDRDGIWTLPYSMTCLTGTFVHEVTAITCSGESAVDADEVTVDTKPTVSASVGGVKANGDVDIAITYGFPNTDHSSQRALRALVEFPGSFGTLAGMHPEQQYGVWNLTMNVACDPRQLQLLAIATSCTLEEAQDRKPFPKPGPQSVSLTLAKGPADPNTGIRPIVGTIVYDMGNGSTNWSIRADLLPWKTADGMTHSGGLLVGPETPLQQTGTRTFTFIPPSGAQQVSVRATASNCRGTVTDDDSIECDACTADPVFLTDGNVRVTDVDPLPPIAGQRLMRTYNSDEQIVAPFGRGWTTPFDRRMILNTDGSEQIVSLVSETNQVVTFRGTGGVFRQTWPESRNAHDTLRYDATTATYAHRAAGSAEVALFSAGNGRLIALRDIVTGREAQFAYDGGGFPQSLTDSWSGTRWVLTRDATRRLVSSIAVEGRPDLVWTYSYDAGDNLQTVLAPGSATWRTYEYASNRMTASRDALGNLIESHTYDTGGYGISSTGPGDEIATIQYNLPGSVPEERVTRLTYKTGAIADYALRPAGGAYRPVRITGACASCGAGEATYVYDPQGRVVREQNAAGYITLKTYTATTLASEERFLKPTGCDPRTDALQCRLGTDALATAALEPTAATIKTTFTYDDLLWPDRVTSIETPSALLPGRTRREDYAYHPASGAVTSTSIRGSTGEELDGAERIARTTFYGDAAPCNPEEDGCEPNDPYAPAFAPGGSFENAWLTLPQPSRLRKSVDGPRIGVEDVTLFVYYPLDPSVPALLRGQLAATRNAAGHVVRYEDYDVFGNATRVVNPNGVIGAMTFDKLGRTVTSAVKGIPGCDTGADPLCSTDLTSTSAYTPASGPLQSQQQPRGGTTVYTYDARGRMQTLSRGPSASDLRERIETTYDPLTGKKSLERTLAFESASWVEKRRESFTYDLEGRLQTVTHADGATVHYAYDAADRIASVRDENHSTPNTLYQYDPAGRMDTVTQTLAGAPGGVIITRYAYDLHGNLVSVTDPNGNVTRYTFDDFGQLLRQESPVSGVTSYTYDDAGNLLTTTDARAATTVRTYDVLGRAVSATSSRSGAVDETVQWGYDDAVSAFALGRLSSMSDPAGSTTYAYERRGLLRREVRVFVGGPSSTTAYAYDADGNRTSIGYPSGQLNIGYTFDHAGRPLTASGVITSATYLPFGPPTELKFANGTTQSLGYDTRYRMLQNELTRDGIPPGQGRLARYNYDYDAAGNIKGILDTQDSEYHRHFGYDDLNRLITANTGQDRNNPRTGGTALWGKGTYTWDAMGNMKSLKLGEIEQGPDDGQLRARRPKKPPNTRVNVPEGRSVDFNYAGTTPLLESVVNNDSSHTVGYDAAGNETYYFVSRTYSPRNLLEQVIDTGDSEAEVPHIVTYSHDGRGLRVIRTESPTNGPETSARRYTTYLPELRLLSVTADDALNVWESATPYEIVWFGDRPVAQITPGAPVRYTFADHLGTPILQTDAAATVIWRVEHEPFGNIYAVREGTRADQPLRFPGQELATTWEGPEESNNIFRWYRSSWGRYSSVDPLAPGGLGHFYRGRMSRFTSPFASARERFTRENAEISNPALLGISSTWRRSTPKGLSDATNPYVYAANSPVMYTDPLGLAPCLTMAINSISGYVPAGPPGKTFKGCQYIGSCYGWLLVHEKEVEPGCKCKDFCLISIEPATAIPNGPTICFNTPPWWAWSPPLINP